MTRSRQTKAFFRRRRRQRSAVLVEAWPPGAKKPWGTPKRLYEVYAAGGWRLARVRGHKPVVGGWYVFGPRALARIEKVREAR